MSLSLFKSFSAEISNSGMYQIPSMPGTPHMDHKSFHGSMMIRGNPKMVMAENGAPSHLPMRDPKRSTLPHGSAKDSSISPRKDDGLACCSGHFVVLWIINILEFTNAYIKSNPPSPLS